MKPVSQGPGCYYVTDDSARLPFNEVCGDGSKAPEYIECFTMGSSILGGSNLSVAVKDLELLAVADFGEGRGSPLVSTRWTGKSHRFGVYQGPTRRDIVVLVAHGAGMRGYIFGQSWSGDMWRALCASLPTERLWDVCREITSAYDAGRSAMSTQLLTAFVDGKVKIRKRNGERRVEVLR